MRMDERNKECMIMKCSQICSVVQIDKNWPSKEKCRCNLKEIKKVFHNSSFIKTVNVCEYILLCESYNA